jgi:hypothetical protein
MTSSADGPVEGVAITFPGATLGAGVDEVAAAQEAGAAQRNARLLG